MSLYPARPTTFEALVAPFSGEVQQLAYRLRELVWEAIPEAEAGIYGGQKSGNALYSVGSASEVICGIQPADALCRLYVHGIYDLTHPALQLEGSGKHSRHVKLHVGRPLPEDAVRWLLAMARERGQERERSRRNSEGSG